MHDGKVVEITCDPVDGWSVLETPVGGNYQLKGPWTSDVSYVMNDFCTFGDNLYICKSDYTSDSSSDNPSIDTDHWELFFDGTSTYQLKGQWSNSESYVLNDFCTFGDNLYICKSPYTSDTESTDPSVDTTHWELLFSGSRITKRLLTPGIDENISWAPTIKTEEFTVLENITSDMTSLVITLSAPPDSIYCYEYSFRIITPAVSGITTFSILDHNGTAVNWLGYTPALVGGKTYEVSVVDGLAVIGESV